MDTDAPVQPTHKPGGEPQVIKVKIDMIGYTSCYNTRIFVGLDLRSRPRS